MKPVQIKTPIGNVTLEFQNSWRRGEQCWKAHGSFVYQERTVEFVIMVGYGMETKEISRQSITCGAKREEGGMIIKSSVGKNIESFIMTKIAPGVTEYLKKNAERHALDLREEELISELEYDKKQMNHYANSMAEKKKKLADFRKNRVLPK